MIELEPRVRIENGEECATIRSVIDAAFGGTEESTLVDRLRDEGYAMISLVAELDGRIVGHLLISRMWVQTSSKLVEAVALAPVAVLPEYQRRGIGDRLIRHGLELIRERGEKIVIVAGHPDYYPRFGFSSEKARCLKSPFPQEAFMAMELQAGALDDVRGAVVYASPFGI